MKKSTVIVLVVIILLIALISIYLYIDYTKVVKKPLDTLKDGEQAYKLEQTTNKITLTVYTYTTPEIITTFNFENGLYKNATFKKVFGSKLEAKKGLDEDYPPFHNRVLNGNIVSGDIDLKVTENKDDYFKTLEETYSKSSIKID